MKTDFSDQMFDQTERPGMPFPLDVHRIIRHRYESVVPLVTGKDVLEVGPGHGMGAQWLDKQARSYTGGEYSDENINVFKSRKLNCEIVKMDAHSMPFAPQSFDVVVALAMIYYLDIDRFLTEVRRVLRPDGKLFFCTSNKDVPGFVPSPYTTKYYSVPELAKILGRHGFRAEFTGAFDAPGGSLFKRRVRAGVKEVSKNLIGLVPGGKTFWRGLRQKSLGDQKPLPWNVEEIEFDHDTAAVPLPIDQVCQSHRVIYVTASLSVAT